MITKCTVEAVQGYCRSVLRKEKRQWLVLSIRLIQQAAEVEIDVYDVAPV